MTFTITTTKPFHSNKPHQPFPTPSQELFPIEKSLPDGRAVWISVPQPDRLTIVVPIIPLVYGDMVEPSTSPSDFANGLYSYFAEGPFNAAVLPGGKNYQMPQPGVEKPAWKHITLAMGERGSSVRFELLWNKASGIRLRLECNPRKLGPAGFDKLALLLGSPAAPFNLQGFIAAARVSRLDICVDVVGVQVSEMTIWHANQGKRSLYVAEDGVLETIYIHRRKAPVKGGINNNHNSKKLKKSTSPAGVTLLTVYDRVRERASVAQPPPFGLAPVVRIERKIARFVKQPLAGLLTLTNRLEGAKVGYAGSQLQQGQSLWFRYMSIRRTATAVDAFSMLGVQPKQQQQFKKAEMVPNPDLLNSAELWPLWSEGMKLTGLAKFLAAA